MEFKENLLAYCGIYCGQCSFKVAFETNNRAHLLAKPAKYNDMKQAPLEACFCEGCKGENICGDCQIKDCASAKGYLSCADCENFPCTLIDNFAKDGIPHHSWGVENLHIIREKGVHKWFENFQNKLTCNCGGQFSWYYKQCLACKKGKETLSVL